MTSLETDRDLLPRYANVTGGWLGLQTAGVEMGPAGELRLQSIPDAGAPVGPQLTSDDAPAGCALDDSGSGYVSDPATGRVLILDTCPPAYEPTTDVVRRRPGDTELLPGAFITPRGLVFGPRGRLYVADAGADAVVVIEPATGVTTGRWTGVTEPWCLATDGRWIYVLDRPDGIGRVRRFDADGVADASFAVAGVQNPVRMAFADGRLYVVDRGAANDTVTGGPQAWPPLPVTRVAGIAGRGGRVYLVAADSGDLLTFTVDGTYIGSTRPMHPVADLFLPGTVVWSYPAASGTLLRHTLDGHRLRVGAFVCGPLATATEHGRRELRARVDRAAGTHVQLWTAVTPGNIAPSPQTIPVGGPAPGISPWAPLPADVDVALIADPTGPQLWIGGQLSGDGSATPAVHQLGVSGSHGWLGLLPAVYRKTQSDFLDRFLRLMQSVEAETAGETADLVRRFDAWTADDPQGALDLLAGWLEVSLDERWDEHKRRSIVATALAAQAVRGTPSGLLAAISARFGVTATICEPAQAASVWPLESGGLGLGFDTMLVAGPADGAVVGASAVVGQSSLTAGAAVGAPLFADLAHRFHVTAPEAGVVQAGGETALRALIEEQKPAHTTYTLCLLGARARVGVQARVGIDTIIAGPAAPLDLDCEPGLGIAPLEAAPPPTTPENPTPAHVGQARLGTERLS